MKETKHYCDHCGKELGWDNGYTDYDLSPLIAADVDVCVECFDEYIKYIKDFFKVGEKNETD